jgi:hypothetical protein
MDKLLRILKRRAIETDGPEDWDKYYSALERAVGGVDPGSEFKYLALVLPGIPMLPIWYPLEEQYNQYDWDLFETDKDAFSFALNRVKEYLEPDYDEFPEWEQIIQELEENLADNTEEVYDLVEKYNMHPVLRDVENVGGGDPYAFFWPPHIYIILVK